MRLARVAIVALSVAAIPCLWEVAASGIWSGMTHKPFSPIGWYLALGWWNANWWCKFCLVVSAMFPTLALLALVSCAIPFVYRRYRPGKLQRPANGGLRPIERGVTPNHGTAAWATAEQIKERFGAGNVLIGAQVRGGRDLISDDLSRGPGHSGIFASPGSDKTATLIHRIWRYNKGPVVALDPSFEMAAVMTRALTNAGRKVHLIGPTMKDPKNPVFANLGGINILDWIDLANPDVDADILTAVEHIYDDKAKMKDGSQADPYWHQMGRNIVAALLGHMIYEPLMTKSMTWLRHGLSTSSKDLPGLLSKIAATSHSSTARFYAKRLDGLEKADRTWASIMGALTAATGWLANERYAELVSNASMATDAILDSDTVVFVCIPLRTLRATPALGRAIMGALFNRVIHADGEVPGIAKTFFALDEAATLRDMAELMDFHITARKYRGAVQLIYQSEAQLDRVWGKDDARVIRDSWSWRSHNAIQDGDIAERLEKDLGRHGVMAYSEGTNRGRSKRFGFALPSNSEGGNVNVHEIAVPLCSRAQILRLPATKIIVHARDFPNPILAETAPYYLYPEVAQLMDKNRFVVERTPDPHE
jgi:type IV secretion system protein VirD4